MHVHIQTDRKAILALSRMRVAAVDMFKLASNAIYTHIYFIFFIFYCFYFAPSLHSLLLFFVFFSQVFSILLLISRLVNVKYCVQHLRSSNSVRKIPNRFAVKTRRKWSSVWHARTTISDEHQVLNYQSNFYAKIDLLLLSRMRRPWNEKERKRFFSFDFFCCFCCMWIEHSFSQFGMKTIRNFWIWNEHFRNVSVCLSVYLSELIIMRDEEDDENMWSTDAILLPAFRLQGMQ